MTKKLLKWPLVLMVAIAVMFTACEPKPEPDPDPDPDPQPGESTCQVIAQYEGTYEYGELFVFAFINNTLETEGSQIVGGNGNYAEVYFFSDKVDLPDGYPTDGTYEVNDSWTPGTVIPGAGQEYLFVGVIEGGKMVNDPNITGGKMDIKREGSLITITCNFTDDDGGEYEFKYSGELEVEVVPYSLEQENQPGFIGVFNEANIEEENGIAYLSMTDGAFSTVEIAFVPRGGVYEGTYSFDFSMSEGTAVASPGAQQDANGNTYLYPSYAQFQSSMIYFIMEGTLTVSAERIDLECTSFRGVQVDGHFVGQYTTGQSVSAPERVISVRENMPDRIVARGK